MNDDQLLRYSRHILLPELGIEAQARWLASHVLLIGAGGLGCSAALYLGSAGVGTLTVMDPDTVDLTNLQRQIAHTQARLGQRKVDSLQSAVQAINPEVTVNGLALRAEAGPALDARVGSADVIIDCSDNFATRHAVNAACVRLGKPLVSGAAAGWHGQVCVHVPQGPCYACLFPANAEVDSQPCATMGVFAPLAGIIGGMQAAEALKLLAHVGPPAGSRLLLLDTLSMQWTALRAQRDPACHLCGAACSAY